MTNKKMKVNPFQIVISAVVILFICITISRANGKNPCKNNSRSRRSSDNDGSAGCSQGGQDHSKGKNKKKGEEGSIEYEYSESEDEDSDDDSESDDEEESTGGKGNRRPNKGGMMPPTPSKKKEKKKRRIILEELFSQKNWSSDWTTARVENNGTKMYNKFSRVYVRKSNHSKPNYGITTNNKGGEYYLISTTFPPFNNRNDSLVIQFSVQFQTKASCQLVFLRIYDCQYTTEEIGSQTPYIMQVGPNICGTHRLNRLTAEFQEPGKSTIKSVDKNLEAINNTSVTTYALVLDQDGGFHVFMNTDAVQNGSLKDVFQNYKGYTSICSAGILVWHSVLDKYFKGQIIVDDILVVNDLDYAIKKRNQILFP